MNFEIEILNEICQLRNPLLDKVMVFITSLGNGGIVFFLIGIAFLIGKKTRKIGITVLLSLVLCGIFGNILIKPIVARPRPFNINDVILLIEEPKDFSFPSGHTYSAFATAMSVYFYNKKLSLLFFIFAITMGFSRLYLYVHYPTDVIAGVVFGILCAVVSKRTVNKFLGKKETL